MPKLFSTAYFPPVSYFAAMAQEMEGLTDRHDGDGSFELSPSIVYIEACENYQKQSYRNRCRFYAAYGVQSLSFPIVHEGGTHKLPISHIKVDYSKPWIQQHERAIVSAYGTSAYFEYDGTTYVYILDETTNLKKEVVVELGMRNQTRVEVISGLEAGDLIVMP